MKLGLFDWSIIALYTVIVSVMGFWFSKKNNSTEEYFVGGRSFSGWVIGLSLIGTSISSVTFIAYPADAFKTTWVRFIPVFAYPLAALFALTVFIPFFRRNRLTSAYEYIEHRFGSGLRLYTASVSLLGQLFRVSIVLYLLSLLMHEMTGLGLNACVVFSGVFVALYTVLGGIDAVIWTDVFQTIILFLGGVVCVVLIAAKLPGGLGEIFSVAEAHQKLSFAYMQNGELMPSKWGFSLSEKTVTMLFIVGFLQWIGGYTADQNTVQRYCASKSTHEARKAVIISCFSSIPIWAFYMFLGTALYVFFIRFPTSEAAEILDGTRKAEQIVPYFVMNYLPVGFKGFVIVSALAAAMSSLDSSINAISTIFIVDIYRRHLAKGRSDAHYLNVAKLMACAVSVIMIVGALGLIHSNTTTVRDMLLVIGSIMTSGILGLYLLGFFSRRANCKAARIGLILSIAFTLTMTLYTRGVFGSTDRFSFEIYYVGIIGNLIMIFVGYLLSLLIGGSEQKELTGLTVWTSDKTGAGHE